MCTIVPTILRLGTLWPTLPVMVPVAAAATLLLLNVPAVCSLTYIQGAPNLRGGEEKFLVNFFVPLFFSASPSTSNQCHHCRRIIVVIVAVHKDSREQKKSQEYWSKMQLPAIIAP
jgi:hypothetical protein